MQNLELHSVLKKINGFVRIRKNKLYKREERERGEREERERERERGERDREYKRVGKPFS